MQDKMTNELETYFEVVQITKFRDLITARNATEWFRAKTGVSFVVREVAK